MRRGTTLIELLIALIATAVIIAISVPTMARQLDRIAVQRAMNELSGFYHSARLAAVVRGQQIRLSFGADSLVASYVGLDSAFLTVPGPARLRVSFSTSRPEILLQANGLGWGAANTKIVVRRGGAADSMSTSILGRLRRYSGG